MKKIGIIIFFFSVISTVAQTKVADTIGAKNVIEDEPIFADPDNNPFNLNILTANTVNTYTGRADISVPLYNLNFEGLEIPINLQYNSEGIKVNQFASEVGLGWSLSSVGEIIKEVNGGYEDNEGRDNWRAYLRGLPNNPSSDFPDYYTINTPVLSGKFFIDKELTVKELEGFNTANITFTRAKTAESEILKYGFVSNRRTQCSSGNGIPAPAGPFVNYFLHTLIGTCTNTETPGNHFDTQMINIIKDKFTYSFSEFEHIHIGTKTKDEAFRSSPTFPEDGYTYSDMEYHNSYKLSKIMDNTTKNTLQVSYIPLARYDETIKRDRIWDKLVHRVDGGSVTNFFRKIENFDISTKEAYIKKLVSKIKTDEVEILFNYENSREDRINRNMVLSEIPNAPAVEYTGPFYGAEIVNPITQEPLLKSIVIKNNIGQIISQYNFIYDYFNSGCTDPVCKRLKLVAIEKGFGPNNLNKETHTFSYYEDTNLPKITSFNKDVFGFKNNLIESSITDSYGFPMRPNLYKYSETRNNINFVYYSPLKVNSLNPAIAAGSFDQGIAGLENIRAWTLKTITYPTQGVQLFSYEPHVFSWKQYQISGGGLRIKEIKMLDPITNKTLTTSYTYSNGQVATLPLVTGEQNIATYNFEIKTGTPQSFNTSLKTSKASYVIYPESRKIDPNGGYTNYKFSSYTEYPESNKYTWDISGSLVDIDLDQYLFSKNSINTKSFNSDYLRGNQISQQIFDKNNILLKSTDYNYTSTEYASPIFGEQAYYPKVRYLYWPLASSYDACFPQQTPFQKAKIIKKNNLTKIIQTDYFSGNTISSETNNIYLERFNLLKSVTNTNQAENTAITNTYGFESGDVLLNNPDYEQILVGVDQKNNNDNIGKSKVTYANINALVLPKESNYNNVESGAWGTDTKYDLYDNKGNILQKTNLEKPSTIIWGYRQSKPIATIEGATYAQVMQAMGLSTTSNTAYLQLDIVKKSDLDIDETTEANLTSVLNIFRTKPELKDYLITTYTYDPLIGIKSSTSKSGITTKYKYDTSNRLQKIVDKDGNTLKEYTYNYSAARFYNREKSQTFVKDCGSSGFGSAYVYTVPVNKYSSLFSQSDADNQADNDMNTNGQNVANNFGTCTSMSCNVIKGSGISTMHFSSITMYGSNPSQFRVKIQYPFESGLNWTNGNGVLVGKITGNCVTAGIRTSSCYSSGVWGITVNPNGDIYVKFVPGATFVLPPNNTIILLDFALSVI
ncbi:DUF5977 domain-containing protein [Chryseobacterium paludis]|uniref:DUF5977 domain-containing protein n=1 Tax=Chryseobacterium paludis TaxID=2956784 RepID=UPI0021C01139|nr:DUF5977 domain-containing protein [Chryseobacterium paludis]